MLDRDYVRLMSEYKLWLNDKVFTACATLTDAERKLDQGAACRSGSW